MTCRDNAGVVVDLTGASARFLMRDDDNVINKIDATAEISDGPGGVVIYDWVNGDTDTTGVFEAEVELTYANSKIETFPNVSYVTVIIDDDIN